MRVVVATCAHRGDDARIVQRQIDALLADGIEVTFIAPEPVQHRDGLRHVVIRRVRGRRRFGAWRDVVGAIRRERTGADLLLVHDLELVPLCWFLRTPAVKVWDVHEDLAGSIADREWLPGPLRGVVGWSVRMVERLAPRRFRLLAAEHGYRDRLGDVPVVPNSTPVPEACAPPVADDHRVVYVGRISDRRGWTTMLELGRVLRGEVVVELIGDPDGDIRSAVVDADAAGDVRWRGYVPNGEALQSVEGAVAGLCLLAPIPNYLHSMPTKVVEYMARGLPVITTDLPIPQRLVHDAAAGFVVGQDDPTAIAEHVRALIADVELRRTMGASGHASAARHHNWRVDGPAFAHLLRELAAPAQYDRPT